MKISSAPVIVVSLSSLLFIVATTPGYYAWSPATITGRSQAHTTVYCGEEATARGSSDSTIVQSRRELFQNTIRQAFLLTTATATATAAATAATTSPAWAAVSSTPSPDELVRLQKGHARVRYLVEHWDEITKTCGTAVMSDTERKQVIRTEGGGGTDACGKTPLVVQEYMGYKSTLDPLYKADKLMVRAGALVDPDDFDNYLDVVERYREKADATALLAYTSSWGEANPNGGKEVIDAYLEQTKSAAKDSERLLRSVLGYLKLEPLPASQGKL